MKIESVYDKAFAPYGRVVEGYDVNPLLQALEIGTPLPAAGTDYLASEPALEALPAMVWMRDNLYGGMPIQLGWCNGYNIKLNCLEYHRDSEVNLGTTDFILLVARQDEMVDRHLDTDMVRAFRCPAGVLVEVYATTLHYAPCQTNQDNGFKVMVALPKGTNTQKPAITIKTAEDDLLWARNKWLLAHPETNEAKSGAWVGLDGANLDIISDI